MANRPNQGRSPVRAAPGWNAEEPDSSSLTQAALDAIREDILSGELTPNTRLRMQMLRERYDIGASPLREALSRLVSDNLVLSLQRRGFVVAPVSLSDFRDLTNLRKLLEKEALSQALARGDDRWEAAIVAAFHQLNRVQERFDPNDRNSVVAWEDMNREFHDALVSACKSAWLLRTRNTAYICSERYRRLCLSITSISRDVKAEHKQLLEAAMDRDVSTIHVLISEHLEATFRKVEESGKLDEVALEQD